MLRLLGTWLQILQRGRGDSRRLGRKGFIRVGNWLLANEQ